MTTASGARRDWRQHRLVRALWARRGALLGYFCGLLLPLVLLAVLAEEVRERSDFGWDRPLLWFLHSHATPLFDAVMLALSWFGGFWPQLVLATLIIGWLVARRRPGNALFFFLAVGGAILLNSLVKVIFHRARPDLWTSLAPEHGYSFPSGHAMNAIALVAALGFLVWPTRWRWPVVVVGGCYALLVGLSRLYLGVHYPSDVIAGWCAGLLWVTAVARVGRSGGRIVGMVGTSGG